MLDDDNYRHPGIQPWSLSTPEISGWDDQHICLLGGVTIPTQRRITSSWETAMKAERRMFVSKMLDHNIAVTDHVWQIETGQSQISTNLAEWWSQLAAILFIMGDVYLWFWPIRTLIHLVGCMLTSTFHVLPSDLCHAWRVRFVVHGHCRDDLPGGSGLWDLLDWWQLRAMAL